MRRGLKRVHTGLPRTYTSAHFKAYYAFAPPPSSAGVFVVMIQMEGIWDNGINAGGAL